MKRLGEAMSRKKISKTVSERLTKKRRQRRLTVEHLEAKRLLTGIFSFADSSVEWAYTFEGDAAADGGADETSLDGTWSHENGSDEWDGSEIGDADGLPGGVTALAEGDTDSIRVQETGDPRDSLGASDPSNRKVYFTHSFEQDDVSEDVDLGLILEDGVTLSFRARVATAATGPVDDLHANNAAAAEPWPEEGIGYWQHNGGKSMIAIKQQDGANIAFGLGRSENANAELLADEDGNPQEGLILPHLLQDTNLSDSSDAGESPIDTLSTGRGNIVPVDDVTEWQEFWITVQEGFTEVDGFEDGTHVVRVWSSADPENVQQFGITGATGSDADGSYIAIGAGNTGRAGAFDIDFVSWTPGLHEPVLNVTEPVVEPIQGDIDEDGTVAFADFLILSNSFGQSVDPGTDGDLDGDGEVAFSDFLILSNNFGMSAAAVAEAIFAGA